MKIEYTHQLSELVFDCILKVNNRRVTFIRFLSSMHIRDTVLATFDASESKRVFLERIYPKLQNSENGQRVIINMALELSKVTNFPDLQGFEDSALKISKAKEAVHALNIYINKNSKDIIDNENKQKIIDENRKIVEENKLKRITLASLESQLNELAMHIGTQEAGYGFEKWFYDLADFFEMQSRRPYRTADNRQVDGSISLNGNDYIVELKFLQKPIDVTDIDPLSSKLKTKADNTLALCVSMSGFNQNAKNDASQGRTMILLLDYNHINLVLRSTFTLQELIERVRRHAAQTGEAYLDPVNMH
ncbi:MAG: restriction endonuclease [Firmicutes bacterium]|nr:restriction endonuclease [Bacillota bacterium]